MKLFKLLIGLFFLSLALTSNAGIFGPDPGMKKECMDNHSKAWCVWDALRLSKDIKDSSRVDVGIEPDSKYLSIAVDLGVNTLLKNKSDPFGKNGSIGMAVLGILLQSQSAIVGQNRVYAWMPLELAKTPEEAGSLMEKIVSEATTKSMDGRLSDERVFVMTPERSRRVWTVNDKECSDCQMSEITANGSRYVRKGTKGKAPEWMGGYDAWIFGYSDGPSVRELNEKTAFVTHTYMPKLSKNLPDWAFISVSPEVDRNGIKYNKGLGLPVIFNNGEMFLPIFPEVTQNNDGVLASF